jgi:DNA recombination protein RmuC
MPDAATFAAGAAVLAALLALAALLLGRRPATDAAEAQETRARLADTERALAAQLTALRLHQGQMQGELHLLVETKLREIGEANAAALGAIRQTVQEKLAEAVEQRIEGSFQRVVDQFAAMQRAMSEVQAVTAQIGDLRRIFSNVKTRGGWGETQLRALLDDILPPGSYQTNVKLREGSDEMVEFAIAMPMRGDQRPWLALDAKFPVEDYERLLLAAETGDAEGERAARAALAQRLRAEARKIATKYIAPPTTVEFAVLYLPTDGLYAEAARIPGLIDEMGSAHRVLVLGPSLAPALLRTIQLGFVTLALEHKADEVRRLLGATRTEMQRLDEVLDRLGKQANGFGSTIDRVRTRTRAVGRRLRDVEGVSRAEAEQLLELPAEEEGPG